MSFAALAQALPAVAQAAKGAQQAVPMALQSTVRSDPIQTNSIPINVGPFGDFNTGTASGSGAMIPLLIGLGVGGAAIWLLSRS